MLGAGGFGRVVSAYLTCDLLTQEALSGPSSHRTSKPNVAVKLVSVRHSGLQYVYAERDCLIDLQMSPFFPR